MNDMKQDSAQLKQSMMLKQAMIMPAMAALAGLVAALVVITLPVVYLENIIGATGLPEFVPATAPPLGDTARGLIAVLACLVSASAVYLLLNRKGDSEMGVALREKIHAANSVESGNQSLTLTRKRRFGLPKFDPRSLTRFLKKPKKNNARIMDLADLPQLRKLDAQSTAVSTAGTGADMEREAIAAETAAPAPLQAAEVSADALTNDNIAIEKPEPAAMPVEEMQAEEFPVENLAPEDEAGADMLAADNETQVEETLATEILENEAPVDDLADLNIAQLADRLEAGLKRLKQLETEIITAQNVRTQNVTADLADDMMTPVAAARSTDATPTSSSVDEASTPPFVSEAPTMTRPQNDLRHEPQGNMATPRHADMDAALKAALGTLERMSAQR
ncbi:hypothetical protein AB1K62_13175 [Parasphingorhabdus sp. JC815]|uniref:hypothetical protein n=1 Tax=Parasphingorhabdus sp. JC815 TaxID=3232140 RepID=UPI0034592A27